MITNGFQSAWTKAFVIMKRLNVALRLESHHSPQAHSPRTSGVFMID